MELTTIPSLAQAEADMTLLETIGSASYYELRLVVKREDGRTAIVGKVSEWPLLKRDAKLAVVNTLLAASEAHVAELIATKEAQERELILLRQQLGAPPVPPAVAAAAVGAEVETAAAIPCPECAKPCPSERSLRMHRWRKHGVPMKQEAEPSAGVAPLPPAMPHPEAHTAPLRSPVIKTRMVHHDKELAPIVVEPPFVCQRCAELKRRTRSTRSVANPSLCMYCNAEAQAAHTNGQAELELAA